MTSLAASSGRFTPQLRKLCHYRFDRCSVCESQLPRRVAAYAGYDKDQREIYVGDCCKGRIAELASHMYWWWSDYPRPEPGTVLWRYMDFSKFVALLKERALYFARVDKLGDPFEGARGVAEREPEWKAHCLDYFRQMMRQPPEGFAVPPPEVIEENAERLYRDFVASGEREVRSSFVSCWHANDGESEALWRIYAPRPTVGIAIRVTFGALDEALESDDAKFGYVRYVDFKTSFAGTYDRIFWKRASLRHEAEVRGVICKRYPDDPTGAGLNVKLDLEKAIRAVVPSPFAPPWFESVARETIARFGLNLPVERSSLLAGPFY